MPKQARTHKVTSTVPPRSPRQLYQQPRHYTVRRAKADIGPDPHLWHVFAPNNDQIGIICQQCDNGRWPELYHAHTVQGWTGPYRHMRSAARAVARMYG